MIKRLVSGMLALMLLLCMLPVMPAQVKAVSNMTVSAELISVLKQMEGFSKYPYWDYAQYTVGYGTRCPDEKYEEYKANGISVEAAELLLKQALESYQRSVNDFADRHGLNLLQQQFDALVSFSYNCGTAWMWETTGYFNRAVRSGDMGSALIYGICLFSTAGGEYILIDRRMCEANMYINGVYKASNAGGEVYPPNFKWVFLDANGGTVPYVIYAYDANEKLPAPTGFKTIPTGMDEEGGIFAYDLMGWYDPNGNRISVMDKTPANGQVLTARWADPDGREVDLPKGKVVNMNITVTGTTVNVRSGPGTYYSKVNTVTAGEALKLTQVLKVGSTTWGKVEKGWMSLSYTNYEQVASQETFPKTGTVTGSGVNYRTAPSTATGAIVGQKNKGDQVVITREQQGGSLLWGQMTDGNWICLDYVQYDAIAAPILQGINMLSLPDKTSYYQNMEDLDTTGGILLLRYHDGSSQAVPVTEDMVSGFSNSSLGTKNLTVTYSGFTTSFPVTVVQYAPPTYTVIFRDWDGTVLQSGEYELGETVTPPGDPVRPGTAQYTYEFTGWDKPVASCEGAATYRATYREIINQYTVTFQDWDGTVLQSDAYDYGNTVTPPTIPVRPGDAQYTYQFTGWDKPVESCTGNAVYTATYHGVLNTYTVTFRDWDGRVLQSKEYTYGETVTPPATPTRPNEGNLGYYFLDWDAEVTACTGPAVYTAVYQQYTVETRYDFSDGITNEDVIYLLWHSLFPESYPIEEPGDFNEDGEVTNEDVIYLLWHTLYPEDYPL